MTQQQNIFLTYENLAFALPLLVVCGSYAFFKYLPLYVALPILGVLVVIFQLKSSVKAHKNKKLETLDEDFIKELAGDTEEEEKKKAEEAAAKARKAKNKLDMRLAQEAKRAKKGPVGKKKKGADGDDDEGDTLEVFVKGARGAKKTK